MISYLSEFSQLVISLSVFIGVVFLIKIQVLDHKINAINKKYDEERRRQEKRDTLRPFMESALVVIEKDRNRELETLLRKREQILSKIPFLK